MKKGIALVSVLAMSLTLAACGGTNNEGTNNTGTNAGTTTNEGTNAGTNNTAGGETATEELVPEEGASLLVWEAKEERPFVEQMAKEFKEKYNVDIRMEEVGAGDQVTKLTTDGPAGIGADVVLFPHDNLGRAVSAGLVLPNDTYAEQAKAENAENAVSAVTYDGVLYGYPRSIETYAMFYNKDLIAAPPTTFDEVKAFAKTFNDTKANKYAFMWDIGNFYFSYPFLATTGGYVFGGGGQDKADIGLNNAGAVEGATYFKTLKDEVLPLKSGDVNYDIKKGLFTGGTLAMNIDGPWAIGDLKKSGINFGAAPIPSINGKPSVSFSGVKGWYVNTFTKYPNAAKLFARYASTKEAQLADFKLTGAIPANSEASADPAVSGDELIKAFVEQFKNSQPMPSIPEMGNVWTPIGAALSDIWNEGKDPKASLDNAVKQIEDANAAQGS
ncbi:sugar ABC transporter substrate-binding protein [Paenibacillus methanolicus]|uniref:Maltodextrin-binding protein n=1 Tax=Paenibacillus methanolicus TaxID=582686 RepID=A0A5S5C863_9BACL|nr:maltose ABC transporter substrate-binding protein [Paenibacillus methanolicus]TYP75595.1 arabinogalactan oligomer/maltooligosaccharide transport system substrate-binding protein [Paenibacillus methanolicus]